jgi:hypothetical protein
MKHALNSQVRLLELSSGDGRDLKREHAPAITVGQIASIDGQGRVLVSLDNGLAVPARLSSTVRRAEVLEAMALGTPVLLLLEKGVEAHPILVGLVRDRLEEPEAPQELALSCGESSITLRRDGKIIIKGEEIVSRARGVNKVKGAIVKIN